MAMGGKAKNVQIIVRKLLTKKWIMRFYPRTPEF